MNKLAEGLQQMRSDTRILKLMADLGLEPVWGKPDEFRALLTREVVTWADLLKKAGIEQR
jgi:tripartite-type tricarboxylate transporter receptor subunit TctC